MVALKPKSCKNRRVSFFVKWILTNLMLSGTDSERQLLVDVLSLLALLSHFVFLAHKGSSQ